MCVRELSTKANSMGRIRSYNNQAEAVLNASATPWQHMNVLECNITVPWYNQARYILRLHLRGL